MDVLTINGAEGEGGGQIIRTSMTLSAITGIPFKIFNIRKQRQKPGLQPQHLMACQAVEKVCSGKLVGAELGCFEFSFQPGSITGGEYEFDIGTAGSTIMVAQTVIPILLNAKEKSLVRIIGGTFVPRSPGYDYFANVFLPAIRQFKANVQCELLRSGYYPKGGGIIEIQTYPSELQGCTQWQQKAQFVNAIIRLGNLPIHIAEREQRILAQFDINETQIIEEATFSPGNCITIWKGFNGASQLGQRGKLAEKVAEEAVSEFKLENEDVDRHLADQLLLYAALAKGKTHYTTSSITQHLLTNMNILSKFLHRQMDIKNHTVFINL